MPTLSSTAVITANDRFKRGFGRSFWIGLILATLAHLILFLAVPGFAIADVSLDGAELEGIDIPDRIEIPPPPEALARPAEPVVGDMEVDEDVTIRPTDLESNPIETLPPPPSGGAGDLSDAPTFTPTTVKPRLENSDQVAQLLERFYPPILRDAGIGGTVSVWFFIDEAGTVVRTLLNESSGYEELDRAALRVADRMRFSPAWNRDRKVPVWVSIPITFEVGN